MSQHRREVAVGGDRPYAITIGPGLLGDGGLLTGTLRGRDVFVISDDAVAPLYLQGLLDTLRGVHAGLSGSNRQLVLTMLAEDDDGARLEKYLSSGHVDGALVVSMHGNDPLPKRLAEAGLPVVAGGRGSARSALTCRYRCGNACAHPAPNRSANRYFGDVAAEVVSRRGVLRGAVVLTLAAGAATAGASASPATGSGPWGRGGPDGLPPGLRFEAVPPAPPACPSGFGRLFCTETAGGGSVLLLVSDMVCTFRTT